MTSKARRLARLSPDTNGQLPTSNIQDDAINAAKIAAGAIVTDLGYTPANKAGDTITNLAVSGTFNTVSGGGGGSSGGSLILNIESLFGLNTCGLLTVRGSENSVNQTAHLYTWCLSSAPWVNTRYIRLKRIDENAIGNNYGQVHAYIPASAGSYTSSDQSSSGTAASVSDIYFRSGAAQGFYYTYSIWRTA